MSLIIASVIAYPVYKIWTTLRETPSLQRNEHIMLMHVVVVFTYAVSFVGNSIIISGTSHATN
jgi:hypothetical protein